MATKKPVETGITLAQVNSAVRNALEKKKASEPKKKPITENPTYKKLLEKYDSAKSAAKRAKENAKDLYTQSSVAGSLIKGALAVPYGWLRNKTRLIDKLPGATLANGAIPDAIIGGAALALSIYGHSKGWGDMTLTALSDLSDIAMINSGLKLGSSITALDGAAEALNLALATAGAPLPTGAAPLHQQPYGQPQVRERFSWG